MSEQKRDPEYLSLSELPAEIQGHITQALKGARQQMVEVGESDPVILVYGDATRIINAGMENNAGKDQLAFMVRQLVQLENAHTVVHIHEMWTLPDAMPAERKRELMQQYGAISRMPERVEQLMVNIECRDGRRWLARADIRRKGRAVTLGEPIIMHMGSAQMAGRFAGWFGLERDSDELVWGKP